MTPTNTAPLTVAQGRRTQPHPDGLRWSDLIGVRVTADDLTGVVLPGTAPDQPHLFRLARLARREARDRGWLVGQPGGKDYCPDHKPAKGAGA